MNRYYFSCIFLLVAIVSYSQKSIEYPKAPKDSTIDIYFGTSIQDPYQWMENPEDERLATWLEAQNKITKKVDRQQTRKETLKAQIVSMYVDVNKEDNGNYVKDDKRLNEKYEFKYATNSYNRSKDLLYRLTGTQNYRTLMRVKDFQKSKDENIWITNKYINVDHDLIAVAISRNGSDWREVYFFRLFDGKQLPDTLKYLRTGSEIVWSGKDVFYVGYNKPQEGRELLDKASGQKLFFHELGTKQSEDIILFQNPDTTGTINFEFTKIKDKFFLSHFIKHKGKLYRALSVADVNPHEFILKNVLVYPRSNKIQLSEKFFIGDSLFIFTNWNAPNRRILLADMKTPNKVSEFIPEYDALLTSYNKLGADKMVGIYKNEGQNMALIFDLKGTLIKKIDFPKGKKVNNLYEYNDNKEYTDFCISSFYHPDLWYQLSLKDLSFKPKESVHVPFDHNSLETRYVKYKSKDGTEIPMYITCLKNTKLNGKNPTLIYGYGGYGTTVEPYWDQSKALWILHGGILAIPNIRGGGARGSMWAKEGRKLKKQNAIDDFIAAAEYLIDCGYTNSKKLAISGGSHGGLLVGAAITQRPELFKAAIAQAGAFDMMRFEKYTVGSVSKNLNEFGSVSDSVEFENLRSYSPLHNVKEGVKYPDLLLITGDKDDRVPPLHSYKFLATLQEKAKPGSKLLLYTIAGAGHAGALNYKTWEESLLFKYYFLFNELGVKFY